MSFAKRLESARTLLRSDKIKDRSSGYESFQQLFASPKAIQHLAPRYDEDDHTLVDAPLYDIFQAVFAAVVAERAASLKNGATAAAQTRLAEATRTLRTMVERSVDVLDRGTVRAIMSHAQQSIVVKFQIHEPIAADYVKIMRAIVGCRAHREHLALKAWYEPAALCFAGILGTRVHKTTDWSTDPPIGPGGDDEEEEDPRPRKRAKLDESAPRPSGAARPAPRRVATPLVRDFASLVRLLFEAPVAPLAAHADVILDFFSRFFSTYPHEVTAHSDIVSSLHRTLVELELNASSALRDFVPRVWPSLIGLWNTKSEALQDELLLVLTYALPFASGDDGEIGSLLDSIGESIIESPRGGDDVLPMSSIALYEEAPSDAPFRANLFTSGSSFTALNARAWAALELGGNVFAKLCEADDNGGRQKSEALNGLVDGLIVGSGVVHRVKLVIFLVDRHWENVSRDLKTVLFSKLVKLLGLSVHEPALLGWIFLALAVFAFKVREVPKDEGPKTKARLKGVTQGFRFDPAPNKRGSPLKKEASPAEWATVWTAAMRQMLNPASSRAASQAALQMLAHSIVDPVDVSADLESMLRELGVQAPPPPADALCHFLSAVVELSQTDIRLSRSQGLVAVAEWLNSAWSDVERALKTTGSLPGFSAIACSRLVCLLSTTAPPSTVPAACPPPDCAISEAFIYRASTLLPRQYLLANVLPDAARPFLPKGVDSDSVLDGKPASTVQRKLSTTFRRSLEALAAEIQDRDTPRVGLSSAAACMALEVVTVALVHESALLAAGIRPHTETIKAVASVSSLIAGFLGSSGCKVHEIGVVLQPLGSLLFQLPKDAEAWGLVEPGPASGLPKAKQRRDRSAEDVQLPRALWLLWQRSDVRKALDPILDFARRLLESREEPVAPTQPARKTIRFDDSDDEGEGRANGRPIDLAKVLLQEGSDQASRASIAALCVRLLVTEAASGSDGPARCPRLAKLLMEGGFDQLVLFGPYVVEFVRASVVALHEEEVSDVFWRLGEDLQTYPTSRSPHLQAFVVRFLQATIRSWNARGDSELGHRALMLCEWLTAAHVKDNMAGWRVRRDFAGFLDAFLVHDPAEQGWSRDGHALVTDRDGTELWPQELLTRLLADADFRVRFKAVQSVPHRLEIAHDGPAVDAIWQEVNSQVVSDESTSVVLEAVLTQTLCHANVIVACAEARPLAFDALVRACMDAGVTINVKMLLSKAADRLGLSGPTAFYELYAPHVCQSVIRTTPDMVNYPPELVGEGLQVDNGLCHLRAIVPELVFSKLMHRVDSAARRIGSDRARALRICFPDISARVIVDTFDTGKGPTAEAVAALQRKLVDFAASCAPEIEGAVVDVLLLERDRILAALLLSAFEALPAPEDDARTAVYFPGNPKAAKHFPQLVKGMGSTRIARPSNPFADASAAFQAAGWFGETYGALADPSILHNVASAIFLACSQNPFTDGKHRSIFSLCGLIALAHRRISTSATLLASLLLNLQPLLEDENTAASVVGVVDWLVRHLLDQKNIESTLSPSFVGLLCMTLSRARSRQEGSISDSQAAASHLVAALQGRLTSAASAHPISFLQRTRVFWVEDWSTLLNEDLVAAVGSKLPTALRFRLARRFVGRAVGPGTLHKLFACALDTSDVRREDVLGFVRLVSDSGSPMMSVVGDPRQPSTREGLSSEEDVVSAILGCAFGLLPSPDMALQQTAMTFVQRAALHVEISDKALSGTDDLSARRARLLAGKSIQKPYETLFFAIDSDFLARPDAAAIARDGSQWTRLLAVDLALTRSAWRPVYRELLPLLESSDAFAAECLPLLVHACLLGELSDEDEPSTALRQALSAHISALLQTSTTDPVVVERIIGLVAALRYHPRPQAGVLGFDTWLDIDWLSLISHAVKHCLPSHACLFLELAVEHGQPAEGSIRAHAHQVYAATDEPDSFYSALSADPAQAIVQRYQHEGLWDPALGIHGAVLEGGGASVNGVVTSLASTGFHQLANMLVDRRDSDVDQSYDLAWRCARWDLPAKTAPATSTGRLYAALRAVLNERALERVLFTVDECIDAEWTHLLSQSHRIDTPAIGPTEALVVLDELRRWTEEESVSTALAGARTERLSKLADVGPEALDRIAAVRYSLLQSVRRTEASLQGGDERSSHFRAAQHAEALLRVSVSQRCRSMGRPQQALNAIVPALSVPELGRDLTSSVREEFARVLWKKGEQGVAIKALEAVQETSSGALAAEQLARLGKWLGAARLRDPVEIVERYFDPALERLDPKSSASAYSHVALSFAAFVDREYRTMTESGRLEQLKQSQDRRARELHELRRAQQSVNRNTDSQRYSQISSAIITNETIMREDQEQMQHFVSLRDRYLTTSLKQYAAALTYGDGHEEVVFRFISLWFAQHANDALNVILRPLLKQIPSWKLVRAAHQLCARLHKSPGPEPTPFQANLSTAVVRLCREHPFHTIFRILALRFALPTFSSRSRRASSTQSSQVSGPQLSQAHAADDVLHEVKKDARLAVLAGHVEAAFVAYHEWADVDARNDRRFLTADGKRKAHMTIPAQFAILALKDLPIPVTTIELPVDKSAVYPPEGLPCIGSFDLRFVIPGGVRGPKMTTCLASDGRHYKALFKGGDDLRQDAVMEQVFELFNDLLRQDPQCSTRHLRVRTYKIIPLSPNAGVIEHVGNTTTLNEILVPLHDRMNSPPDWKIARARKVLQEAGKQPDAARIETFKDVITHVRPAMRLYFLESQRDPTRWYQLRLAFTRSVATSSIVGYILGLGDRHVSNIMLDHRSGEVVPIDLGIAFDAGKRLAIPERVPFRLTRDMVDGFGLSGTEGVFRRCCEHTLRVLREKKSVLMTIIEVLKHDPLQVWTLSSGKATRAQGLSEEREEDVPEDAERVIASVANKLSSDLTVETIVNGLIVEATNVANIGAMYHGWQPCPPLFPSHLPS